MLFRQKWLILPFFVYYFEYILKLCFINHRIRFEQIQRYTCINPKIDDARVLVFVTTDWIPMLVILSICGYVVGIIGACTYLSIVSMYYIKWNVNTVSVKTLAIQKTFQNVLLTQVRVFYFISKVINFQFLVHVTMFALPVIGLIIYHVFHLCAPGINIFIFSTNWKSSRSNQRNHIILDVAWFVWIISHDDIQS